MGKHDHQKVLGDKRNSMLALAVLHDGSNNKEASVHGTKEKHLLLSGSFCRPYKSVFPVRVFVELPS